MNPRSASTSTPHYYPFGTVISERSWSDGYRYGFNGKEKDAEGMGGGLSTYDYGFRIYNAALGKFLSVDPLVSQYAMLSPYQFASNMPIKAIDIEGLERLDVTVTSPTYGTPGKCHIVISLDYLVITEGKGAMNGVHDINADKFHELAEKGNTTLSGKNPPTASEPIDFVSYVNTETGPWYEKNAGASDINDVYEIMVEYNYNIIKKEGTTINDAVQFIMEDPAGRGVIFLAELTSKDAFTAPEDSSEPVLSEWTGEIILRQGIFFMNNYIRSSNEGAMAAGMCEGMGPNMPALNIIAVKDAVTQSFTNAESAIHEAGHNSSANHLHESGSYEYNQTGLQSNQTGKMYPTDSNTKNIINDKSNRRTIDN